MRTALAAIALILLGTGASAQQEEISLVSKAEGAVLRGLDMSNGDLTDIEMAVGQTVQFERLEVTLKECRYPADNPSSDAFAYLILRDIREETPRFEGWMIASSPALSALDHPRYDIWVLRCKIPKAEPSDGG